MKNTKRVITGILALSLVSGMTACSDSSSGEGGGDDTTVATTTGVTVAINEEGLKDGEQEVLEGAMSKLKDVELENKEVKWLAHYDINPSTNGASKAVGLEMFEQKYGGTIKWYECTWNDRFDKLSTFVLGGEGIDIFPGDDVYNFPGRIFTGGGMFQPVDDYIDINDSIWDGVREGMELYSFGGKHFNMVTSVTAEEVVVYNRKTIDENGLDDPWELFKEGNWNWDTFRGMLLDFVDEEYEQYGLDGYWAENALYLSAGVPLIGTDADGHLVCNINDPTIEKAMNWQYELYRDGLVFNRENYAWQEQPQMMATGQQLFYIIGAYAVVGAPETWSHQIEPENVGFAPVPSPAGSNPYQVAKLNGYAICKNAGNPEGAARFAECMAVAAVDEGAISIADRKTMDDSKLSEELIAHLREIDELARQYPVVDLSSGASTEIAGYTSQGGDNVGTRAAMHGTDWASNREMLADGLTMLVADVDAQLQAKIAEWN